MTYRVEAFDIGFERTFNCVTDSMQGVRQLLVLCERLRDSHRIKVSTEDEMLLEEKKKNGTWYETN